MQIERMLTPGKNRFFRSLRSLRFQLTPTTQWQTNLKSIPVAVKQKPSMIAVFGADATVC